MIQSLRGVIVDLPAVANTAKEFIKNQRLQKRCRVVACDFFKDIPAGCDAYLLSNILHDWDDELCRKILNNCYKAMKPGMALLVVEAIISPGNEFSISKLLDIEVFVMGGGRERCVDEFQDLFVSTGFRLSKIIPTGESVSIIEGIRI